MLCSVFLKKLSELDTWRTKHNQPLSRWTVSESRIFKKIRKQKQQRCDTGPEFILLQLFFSCWEASVNSRRQKRRRDAQLYKNPVESVATGGVMSGYVWRRWSVKHSGGSVVVRRGLITESTEKYPQLLSHHIRSFHYQRDDDPNHTASVGKTQDFCTALHFLDNYFIAPDFTWPNHTVVWCTPVGQLCVADVFMQLQEEHLQTGFVPFLPELLKKFGFLNFSAPHSPTEILHLLENLLQLIRVI